MLLCKFYITWCIRIMITKWLYNMQRSYKLFFIREYMCVVMIKIPRSSLIIFFIYNFYAILLTLELLVLSDLCDFFLFNKIIKFWTCDQDTLNRCYDIWNHIKLLLIYLVSIIIKSTLDFLLKTYTIFKLHMLIFTNCVKIVCIVFKTTKM